MKIPKESYGLGVAGGRPAIERNGSPVVLPSYCSCGSMWPDRWRADHEVFIEGGWRNFWLSDSGGYGGDWFHTEVWSSVEGFDVHPKPAGYWGLNEQAEWILERCPDARFWVRCTDVIPSLWTNRFPEQMQTDSRGEKKSQASLASEQALSMQKSYLRAVGNFCRRKAWNERLIGIVLFPIAEGQTVLACEGWLFDQAPVMQDAFREFLFRRYPSDEELQAAWGTPGIRRDEAAVPRGDEARRLNELPYWPAASEVRKERDYFDLQQELFSRSLTGLCLELRRAAGPGRLTGIDAFKGTMSGWMCSPIFSGRSWLSPQGDGMVSSGAGPMSELLDKCDVDLIVTPHDYRRRWAGAGFSPEGIGDSVTLRGRLMLIEEDQRTNSSRECELYGAPRPDEIEAVLMRNFFASLSRGHQNYLMDVCGGYFQNADVQRVLKSRRQLEERLTLSPGNDVPSLVMLIDPNAGYWTNFSSDYGDLAVIRQRIWGMDHCGVPCRYHLIEDLALDRFPRSHRAFLLPNLFCINASKAALIRKHLFRDGNVVVFGPGTGMTDGSTVSPDAAAALLGFPFELHDIEYPRFVTIDRFDHPLTTSASAVETFGDTLRYGPVLLPWDAAISDPPSSAVPRRSTASWNGPFTSLGSMHLDLGKRRPGLVVREFGLGAAGNGRPGKRGEGDYAVVFSAAMPLPARLLREIARWSGTHVWNESDDFTVASDSLVAIHAVKPGPREIALPGEFQVQDAISGCDVSGRTRQISFRVHNATTRAFRLLPALK